LAQSAEKCDIEGVKSAFTKESKDFIESMAKMAQSMGGGEAQDPWKGTCENFKKAGEVVKEDVKGDTAELTVKEGTEEQKIPYKKEDGKWKIDLMAMMKGAFEQMKAQPAEAEQAPAEQPKEAPAETQPEGEQKAAQPENAPPPNPPAEAPKEEAKPQPGATDTPPGGGENAPAPK
ncbi:MAG: hypothetical protein FJ088_09175, partial [Deltaproteobacteria bacterium]|nr:hypothetical protein [Deltaproteobacteria bacterium]